MRILFEAILSPPLELEVQYSFSLYPCFDLLILEEKLDSPCLVQCLTVLTSHCMPFCAVFLFERECWGLLSMVSGGVGKR